MAGPFGKGSGEARIFLSHAHWDHIQGFPFFAPMFIPGNKFTVYGPGRSSSMLEGILEGQMNPHFSPLYTMKNLGATIEVVAVDGAAERSRLRRAGRARDGAAQSARRDPGARLSLRGGRALARLRVRRRLSAGRGRAPTCARSIAAPTCSFTTAPTRPKIAPSAWRRGFSSIADAAQRGDRRAGEEAGHVPLRPGLLGRRRRRAGRARRDACSTRAAARRSSWWPRAKGLQLTV